MKKLDRKSPGRAFNLKREIVAILEVPQLHQIIGGGIYSDSCEPCVLTFESQVNISPIQN